MHKLALTCVTCISFFFSAMAQNSADVSLEHPSRSNISGDCGKQKDKDFAGPSSYSVYLDEDNLQAIGTTTDRNYTLGFGVKVQNISMSESSLGQKLAKLKDNEGLFFHSSQKYFPVRYAGSLVGTSGSFMLLGTGFTPRNLNTSAIQYGDRPYSAVITIGYGLNRLYDVAGKNPRYFTTEVSVGALGTGVGAQLQTLVHQAVNDGDSNLPHTPKGWGNQISNGGEATFLIMNRVSYRIFSLGFNKWQNQSKCYDEHALRYFDFTYSKEGFIGYYTGAAIAGTARFGLLDSRNWTANNFPLQAGAQAGSDSELAEGVNVKRNFYARRRNFELYVSSQLKPTIMLYNALLEGQFKHSVYTISGNNTNPFIYTWTNALVLNIPIRHCNINLCYNFYSYRSAEFRGANYFGESHSWGGAYFSFLYYPSR